MLKSQDIEVIDQAVKAWSALAAIPAPRGLDLSGLNVRDPSAIPSTNNLEYLQIRPRSDLSKKFGAVTTKGANKIAALKLKLLALV